MNLTAEEKRMIAQYPASVQTIYDRIAFWQQQLQWASSKETRQRIRRLLDTLEILEQEGER